MAAVVGGLAVVGLGMLAVRAGTVSAVEESVFHAVNDLPDALYPAVWPLQQLGALVLGPVVAARGPGPAPLPPGHRRRSP